MKQVLNFLNEAQVYYLATVEGDQARVRPIGFAMDFEGQLAFCTSNEKDMYRQMVQNPKVEISGVDAKMNTIRLTGKVKFITSDAAQKKALEVMPSLGNLYTVGDSKFEIFTLEDAKAYRQTMSGEKEILDI